MNIDTCSTICVVEGEPRFGGGASRVVTLLQYLFKNFVKFQTCHYSLWMKLGYENFYEIDYSAA
jgi:hypothetical protein